ncbi:hypothetical protein TNCV_2432361 [Trichonephila clavipes]|nr:hypothetical protein TNCV_2432361 [Trichonephila clavipes]
MSSSLVSLKTCRAEEPMHVNHVEAQTTSHWSGVEVKRGMCHLRCHRLQLTLVLKFTTSFAKTPRVAEYNTTRDVVPNPDSTRHNLELLRDKSINAKYPLIGVIWKVGCQFSCVCVLLITSRGSKLRGPSPITIAFLRRQ